MGTVFERDGERGWAGIVDYTKYTSKKG